MNLQTRPINFEDERGTIRDIFASASPDCVTMITSKSGAIRGNHLHRQSTQYAFVVSGRMWAYSRREGAERIERRLMLPGDLVRHEPNEEHAYFAIDDGVFLAFAEGLRKGEDYEKDTYRVPSLIDAWNKRNEATS